MSESKIKAGTIAVCSQGYVGLITHDYKQTVYYPDGSQGYAYVGIHLTGNIGKPWSSKNPKVMAYIEDNKVIIK